MDEELQEWILCALGELLFVEGSHAAKQGSGSAAALLAAAAILNPALTKATLGFAKVLMESGDRQTALVIAHRTRLANPEKRQPAKVIKRWSRHLSEP